MFALLFPMKIIVSRSKLCFKSKARYEESLPLHDGFRTSAQVSWVNPEEGGSMMSPQRELPSLRKWVRKAG